MLCFWVMIPYILMILPVFLSGVLFIFVLKKQLLGFANKPIDGLGTFRGKRMFGNNKTWRGFMIMPLGTLIFGFLTWSILSPQNISQSIVFMYFFAGIAYALAELPNSFVKRQLDIPPGGRSSERFINGVFWFIDKSDSLLAICLVYLAFGFWSPLQIAVAFCLGFTLHCVTDLFMKRLHLKN